MENKTKIFWLIAGLSLGLIYVNSVKLDFSSGQARTAGLMIYFDQDRKRMFEGAVVDGMTLLDALEASAAAGNFRFDFKLNQQGEIISVSLDGQSDGFDSAERWRFYLNKKPVATPELYRVKIKKGDLIEVRLE